MGARVDEERHRRLNPASRIAMIVGAIGRSLVRRPASEPDFGLRPQRKHTWQANIEADARTESVGASRRLRRHAVRIERTTARVTQRCVHAQRHVVDDEDVEARRETFAQG